MVIANIVNTVRVMAKMKSRKFRNTNFLVIPGEIQRVSAESCIRGECDGCVQTEQ
jgi:hypothetical protein